MTWAALFPGQGTQQPGMLPWLEHEPLAAPALGAMASLIGADWRERLADPAWRSSNAVAQPLLAGTSLAAWATLAASLPPPAVVAGYSVGELAAFSCAGVFNTATALRLAARRAALMDAAMDEPGGMLSVAGPSDTALDALQDRFGLQPAILLAPGHRLLAGPAAALDAAEPALAALGAEPKRLEIRTASHTRWMQPAADALSTELAAMAFARPTCWVVTNAGAAASRDPNHLRQALAAQTARTVDWPACMQALAERQPRCVLEVGPGGTLAQLWRRAQPRIPVRSLQDFQHASAAAAWVLGQR